MDGSAILASSSAYSRTISWADAKRSLVIGFSFQSKILFVFSSENKKTATATRKGLRCGSFRKLLGFFFTEALFELSYATTSIKDALLAGVERVAYRTDFNID
jgi:hypothetical protein